MCIRDRLFDYYATPGKLLKLIKLSEEYDLDLVNFDLNTAINALFLLGFVIFVYVFEKTKR